MAPKRGADGRFKTSGGSLTGGTGDVKPQWLTSTSPFAAGANDYSVQTINVPRIILGQSGVATVMEILRVDWYLGLADLSDEDALYWGFLNTSLTRTQDETSSFATLAEDAADPQTFALAAQDLSFTTSGANSTQIPISLDMTDGNGNGILIATDRLFLVSGTVVNTSVTQATVKILYRMVNVGITEYVGIVQSQI